MGHTYGTIKGATTVRLRETPDLNGRTLTLLSQGAICSVTGQEGDFYKVAVDTDLEGYVSKEYIETETEFKEAVSTEEEQAQAEEKAQAQKEADAAIQALEQAKAQQQDSGFSSASKKTSSGIPVIEANPEKGTQENVAAPVVSKPEDVAKNTQTDSNGPSAGNEDSSKVVSASRNAVVAYAKQFLGNPYVYGGGSPSNRAGRVFWRDKPYKRSGLFRFRYERIFPFWHQHREKFAGTGRKGKNHLCERGTAGRSALLCQRRLHQPCGDLCGGRKDYPCQQPRDRYLLRAGQLQNTLQGDQLF